jgi:hypothetical protein
MPDNRELNKQAKAYDRLVKVAILLRGGVLSEPANYS